MSRYVGAELKIATWEVAKKRGLLTVTISLYLGEIFLKECLSGKSL